MSDQLTIKVVGTDAQGAERIYSRVARSVYCPNALEELIEEALNAAIVAVGGETEASLRPFEPEVSVSLTGESIRPSLHLSPQLLSRLAQARASVDFDPYV